MRSMSGLEPATCAVTVDTEGGRVSWTLNAQVMVCLLGAASRSAAERSNARASPVMGADRGGPHLLGEVCLDDAALWILEMRARSGGMVMLGLVLGLGLPARADVGSRADRPDALREQCQLERAAGDFARAIASCERAVAAAPTEDNLL